MASCVFAAIPDSEFAIGGITIGSSADYVQSIYGEPTHISDKVPNAEGGYSYSYAYGSSFYIFFDANTNVVTGIFSTANNGLTTPAGLTNQLIVKNKNKQPDDWQTMLVVRLFLCLLAK